MRTGGGVASRAPGPACWAVSRASALRTFQLNFARAELKSHFKAVSISKKRGKKEKRREGRGPGAGLPQLPFEIRTF